MRLYVKIIITLIIVFLGCKNEEPENEKPVFTTTIIQSDILNEERKILISKPILEHSEYFAQKKFPIIYVLDGEDMFHYISSMVNFLSVTKGNKIFPQTLVVGIVNTNRSKDLTHEEINFEPDSGGGFLFSNFIENELFKYINENYPVKKHKTLIGHSYGGLFVLNVLKENPNLFDNYIALDPSYQYMQKSTIDLSSQEYNNKQLYIAIANTLIKSESLSYGSSNNHYNSLIELCNQLTANSNYGIMSHCEEFKNDDHASLCIDATYKALRKLFSWYELDISRPNLENLTEDQIYDKLEFYNKTLSTQFKENSYADEEIIYQLANNIDNRKLKHKLLLVNLKNNSESFNAHYILGKYHKSMGNMDSTKFYLKEALRLHKDELTLEELNEITMGNM